MPKKVSKTVDDAIARMYAIMAAAAAQNAVKFTKEEMYGSAESAAEHAEQWLKRAGARATGYYFGTPQK